MSSPSFTITTDNTAASAPSSASFVRTARQLLYKGDNTEILSELAVLAEQGVDEQSFSAIMDVIIDVDSPCSVRDKKALIKLLVPRFEPDTVTVYKVLSSVGFPRVYYKQGAKIKHARLPLAVQTALLDWMVCNIYEFGSGVFKELHKLSVILFNLLSFEFCRVQICHLIFLMLTNTNKTRKFNNIKVAIVKQWQIKMVVDLSVKFPLDNSLKVLLVLFKQLVPGLDYKQYNSEVSNVRADSGLKIPFADSKPLPARGTDVQSDSRKRRVMDTCIGHYKIFNSKISKRRKTNEEFLTWYNSNLSINDMASLSDLVVHIQELNVSYRELFRQSTKLKYDYIIMKQLIDGTDPNFQYYMEKGEGVSNLAELLKFYPRVWGSIRGTRADAGVIEYVDELPMDLIHDVIQNNQYDVLFSQLSRYFLRVIKRKQWSKLNQLESIFRLVDTRKLNLQLSLALVMLLRVYSKIPFEAAAATQQVKPEAVLAPSPVIYHLLFTINPLVFSETCGYINSIKKYAFDEHHRRMLNTIIMDVLNFVWRDRAFYKQPNTLHQSMYLPEAFVGKLPTLNVFNQSKLVEIDRVGNLFHNPIWSYITTEIVWELEDELASTVETDGEAELIRHPGPITDESIGALINDDSVKWINLDYEEVKQQVLDRLEPLGYTGLCELLYSSIKSLRTKKSTSND